MEHLNPSRVAGSASVAALVEFALSQVSVKCNVSSRQHGDHGYALEPRVVTHYNLIYVTRGRPVWVIDGEVHDLSPGCMVIVPPGVPHHAYCRTRRFTLGSLHVEANLPGGQDMFALLRPPRLVRFEPGTPLDRYLRGALAEHDRPSRSDTQLMLRSWSRLVTIEMFRQCHAQGQLQPLSVDPIVTAVMAKLTERSHQRMSLPELAAMAGYSPQHLNRRFRRALGVTPRQYLTRLRMDAAAAMLIESDRPVKDVAAAVGFDDPYYFSRAFRQQFGSSPAQFREATRSFSPL